MKDTAQEIQNIAVGNGSLAIFWLGQAGFVFKSPDKKVIYVDPYLSDCAERLYGFKRLMAAVIEPEDVRADFIISTHFHEDHLDIDACPVIAKNSSALFVGPADCMKKWRELEIDESRLIEVNAGQEKDLAGVKMTAVFADHGELAPDAIGIVLDYGFVRVYVTGDTAYRPDKMTDAISKKPEIVVTVINGQFGNMNPEEAAKLTRDAGARVAIPCHFWTFAEHNGDPGKFVEACKEIAPDVRVELIRQGGCYVYGG